MGLHDQNKIVLGQPFTERSYEFRLSHFCILLTIILQNSLRLRIIKLEIKIESVQDTKISCLLVKDDTNVRLNYFPDKKAIEFSEENILTQIIHKNRFQFEKVMSSAVKGNIRMGQIINCVFIEGFNFLRDADFYRIIQIDRRSEKLAITTCDNESEGFHKIYADGSFFCKTGKSGYGGFIETPDGNQEKFYQSFSDCSNNLMELMAVTEGLKRMQNIERIQVNTDSRFVIRGLTQWVHFWRHNTWQTAYGSKVKFAKHWQQADRLCEGKLIEFRWIKGHSGHPKQSLCDQIARESANNKQ